jgi:signal transduction histidine kinase/CheY-like chemotaxis protein
MPAVYTQKLLNLAAALLVALVVLSAWPVLAQVTKTARLELNDNTTRLPFGTDIYITEDKDLRLNEQIVANRHENNLRGARQDSRVINLGVDPGPVWLVFSVTNNSTQEDWVLNFGSLTEGRLAMVRKLMVKNHTRDQVFVRAMREDGKTGAFGETLTNASVPVKIGIGKSELFVVYLEADGNLPATLVPTLMSPQEQLNNFSLPGIVAGLFILFFIAAAAFFGAAGYFERNPMFGLFSAYYAGNLLIFLLLQSMFFVPFTFGENIATLLFPLTFLVGLGLTWMFLGITAEDYSDNAVILSLGSFTIVAALISLVLPDRASIFDELLIFLPSIIGMFAIAGLAFNHAQKGKFAGYFLATGWLMPLVGSLLVLIAGTFSGNQLLLNTYWLSLVPQALFFAGGVAKKIQEFREAERTAFSRENRAAQSLARLKQSKETADQARLLRVIERERELMAELREQEMQRTEEMRRAKEMADHANRAKSAFLAVVSHEIRTPMTGIMGILRLFKDTKLSKEQTEFLLTIQKSSDTMMALLNDILDFEKIESGSMELEDIEFDLPKLVQGVVTLMSGHAADRKVELRSDIPADFPATLMGDPNRLRQILLNLVNNAIKFTENGTVTIRLRATKLENKQKGIKGDYEVYYAVEDTGIGISEKAQEKLFTPFEQADASVSRKYGGTGLGLAICRKLVTAMGGAISLTSQIGVGTTFFFSLLMQEGQAGAEQETAAQEQAPIAAAGPPMRLLVVEDNEINRKVLQNMLEKESHIVTVAESGEMGLEVFGSKEFDAVFMDINLSGMNGLEVARMIRSMPGRAGVTPIIALTGNVAEEDIQSFYKAGFNGFLAKPIDYDRLFRMLADIRQGELEAQAEAKAAAEAVIPEEDRPLEMTPQDTSDWDSEPDDSSSNEYSSRENDSYARAKPEEDISPLHKFLQEQDMQNEQPPSPPPPPPPPEPVAPTIDFTAVFDMKMLDGLLRSLGKDQMKELLDGFIEKTDEIVVALQEASKTNDKQSMYERAHELKGMAANFGMKDLAKIATVVEKAAQNDNLAKAAPEIEKLPQSAEKTKGAIVAWLQ